ncbi:ANTAR domain-containing protein [Cellulosimicrobium cellulans]|uniref:ANTAR domain-containing protein n=1 Tax=Cellulosimicrobium cellulans TaxID=1710 RepID=UPI0008494971|nr:ANTAR domain-containing protein [Cellulosimicrobium cellulans]
MEFSRYPAEFATRVAAVLGAGLEASVSVSHHGAVVRAGSSSDAAARCDRVEALADDGPCVHAMKVLQVQVVPDISVETRWQPWTKQVVEEGYSSSIAVPAHVAPGVAVALNLYAREGDPWDAKLLTATDSYVQLIASAIGLRLEVAELEDSAADLYRRMSDTVAEERAIGALMQSNRCTEEEARRILETASRKRDVSRREVAETLLKAMLYPDDRDVGGTR